MTKYVTATQARKNFFKLMDLLRTSGVTVMVMHQDKPPIVMMSAEEWEGWMETLDILSSDPDIVHDLRKADREIVEGKTITLEELEKKHTLKK